MLASTSGSLSAKSEITQHPEGAHLLFGEEAGFTGQWRLLSAKTVGAILGRVLEASCKLSRFTIGYGQ